MDKIPHIALIIETSSTYGRGLLEGINRYVQSHQPWSIFLEQSDLFTRPPAWLNTWDGDGIICRNRALLERISLNSCPIIDLSDIDPPDSELPRIESDHRAIGALAAEHLLDRGFERFAFCGFSGHRWSDLRREGFITRLNKEGFSSAFIDAAWNDRRDGSWKNEQHRLAKWLDALDGPLGVFAANDIRGQHVLDACVRADLSVPEHVAVVGCDDDPLLCGLCRPALSSVVPNTREIGYRAAEVLDAAIREGGIKQHYLPIPPIQVNVRQSSDILAIKDPIMQQALKLIREQACFGLRVEQLLEHLGISRTNLERRFREHLDRSPHAEIRRVQIKRTKELLAETDLPLDRIAQLCGFDHPEYLNVLFKRTQNITPGRFRRDIRSEVKQLTH